MKDGRKSKWGWRISAVVLVSGLVLGTSSVVTQAGERDDNHNRGNPFDQILHKLDKILDAIKGDTKDSDQQTLASSTMFGGPLQDGALVYVRNVSSKPVTISDKRIVNEQGNDLPINYDTCGSSVAPTTTCVFITEQPYIVGGQAYAASVTVKGASASAVRAQFEIRNSFHAPPLGPLARDNMR